MASSDSGRYLYNIERLRFRNKASIKLPKSGDFATLNRETCYKIAVDIVIESITKPDFRNFKTTPDHGFYGYATLIMRDCIAPKIQLEFGRNRIFEQRIVEAFDGWNSLAFYLQTTKRFLELLANSLRVGDPPSSLVNLCDINAFSVAWSEIDLREIYVNCTEDTQFRIELSWIAPEKFTDDCGKEQDGKSKEPDDAEKDDGLPPDGTQPKKNNPSQPFAGNNPVSPLGSNSPYYNPKGDLLNQSNPDNAVPLGEFYLEIPYFSAFGNGDAFSQVLIIPVPRLANGELALFFVSQTNLRQFGSGSCPSKQIVTYTLGWSDGSVIGDSNWINGYTWAGEIKPYPLPSPFPSSTIVNGFCNA